MREASILPTANCKTGHEGKAAIAGPVAALRAIGERRVLLLQLFGTLAVLAFVPGNALKTMLLIVWWLATFGSVSRAELALFVGGSALFAALDILAVRGGAFAFSRPDLLGLPWWEFPMWGFYLLHVRRWVGGADRIARPRLGLSLVMTAVFAAAFMLAPDSRTRFLTTAVALAGSLLFFHARSDVLAAGCMLLLGAAVEYTGVWSGQWGYAEAVPGGVPLWSATMWAAVGLFAGRLAAPVVARLDVRRSGVANGADIFLVNSFSPRRRSLSDVFLDNGLAMLRAHLEASGFRVAIEDRSTIRGLDAFSPRWMTRWLRPLSLALLDARAAGRPARLLKMAFVGLQHALTAVQELRSRAYARRIAVRVAREGIPVVGIKVWYGNAFVWSKRLVAELRRRSPETVIIAGGPHANLYNHDGAILRYSNFDLAVYGEGEHALAAIMAAVRKGGSRAERLERIAALSLPNLIRRDGAQVVVNEAARPRIAEKQVPDYSGLAAGKALVHTLVDGLGCDWNRCTFCPHKNIYRGYCRRPVAAVVDEMETMISRGIAIFRFAAGDTPRPHALAIAREVLARGLVVEFSMFHRAARNARGRFDRLVEDYRLLMRAGLRAVFMGLETGDDDTNREVLAKNLTAEDVAWTVRAIRHAREAEGLRCDVALSMIHPVPSRGLSWETLRERTFAAVAEARPDSALVTPPCAFPGTEWFARAADYGFGIGPGFVEGLMNYEFVLYKPTDLWPTGTFSLDGRGAREMLAETMRLRAEFERASIPTDVGDENFLILQASGADPLEFKRRSLADILSCDYRYSAGLYAALNAKSARLAAANRPRTAAARRAPTQPAAVAEEVLR